MTRYEPMGTSSAVTSVLHTGGMKNNIEVTKAGSYIYRGDASNFHEWEFRTRLRLKAAGDDEGRYAEQMSKVVDGLQEDVLTAAREVGLEKLRQPGRAATEEEEAVEPGIDILMKAIKAAVFPPTTIKIPEPPEPLYAPTPRCLCPCRRLVPIDTRGRRRRCNRPCKRSNIIGAASLTQKEASAKIAKSKKSVRNCSGESQFHTRGCCNQVSCICRLRFAP